MDNTVKTDKLSKCTFGLVSASLMEGTEQKLGILLKFQRFPVDFTLWISYGQMDMDKNPWTKWNVEISTPNGVLTPWKYKNIMSIRGNVHTKIFTLPVVNVIYILYYYIVLKESAESEEREYV